MHSETPIVKCSDNFLDKIFQASINESLISAIAVTQRCEDNTMLVSLANGSPQCVVVEVLKENKSLLKRTFEKVAPSCKYDLTSTPKQYSHW